MTETVEVEPSSGSDSFASLLAGFAAPKQNDPIEWNLEGLAEDIATISSANLSAQQSGSLARVSESRPGAPISVLEVNAEPDSRLSRAANDKAQPKSASVTIRLTRAESNQLHARAAEAGMTISAYLRSCIFEVEELRAQVKQALAQFSSAAASERKEPEKLVASGQNWRSRFFSRWSGYGQAGQA